MGKPRTGCKLVSGDQSTASGPGQAGGDRRLLPWLHKGAWVLRWQTSKVKMSQKSGLGDFLTLGQYKRKTSPQPPEKIQVSNRMKTDRVPGPTVGKHETFLSP